MNKEEGNKIIGDFMGKNFKDPANLMYDIDWNELMPVVEKIESTGCDTNIFKDEDGQQMIVWKEGFSYKRTGDDIIIENSIGGKSKIEAVYKTVVEFIKWYNQNKAQ